MTSFKYLTLILSLLNRLSPLKAKEVFVRE
jgi:hypothetical protein